jgi:hypothetical protein
MSAMPAWCTTSSRATRTNKLRTFLNAGQGQTPPVSDFVHTVFKSIQFSYVPQRIGDAHLARLCPCISTYGDECFYVQFDRQTAKGPVSSAGRAETGQYVQRWPMSTSPDWIITVSIANGRSISSSKNGTMRGGSLSQRVLMVTRMPLMMA